MVANKRLKTCHEPISVTSLSQYVAESFGDSNFKYFSVRTSILVLLIAVLLIVGVLWYLRSSDDEEPKSLEVIPKLGGGSLIQFNPTDRESIKTVALAIEDALRRKP